MKMKQLFLIMLVVSSSIFLVQRLQAQTSKQLSDALGAFVGNASVMKSLEGLGVDGERAISCLKGAALLAATGETKDAENLIDVAQELIKPDLGSKASPINLMLNQLKGGVSPLGSPLKILKK